MDTGVYPYNICFYNETQTQVKNSNCCPDFNTGLTAYCIAPSDNPTGDKSVGKNMNILGI